MAVKNTKKVNKAFFALFIETEKLGKNMGETNATSTYGSKLSFPRNKLAPTEPDISAISLPDFASNLENDITVKVPEVANKVSQISSYAPDTCHKLPGIEINKYAKNTAKIVFLDFTPLDINTTAKYNRDRY
jgi:hypothetical protein